MKYRPGDYCCVDIPGKFPFSWFTGFAIRHFTHSDFDHVFVITSEDGEIVEARPSGAQISNISEYDGLELQFSTTDLTDEQRANIVEHAYSYVGTPYGFLDIAYLGLYLNHIQPEWLFNKVVSEHRMICSQLVATAGVKSGVKSWLCGKSHEQLVTPADLGNLAKRQA